MTLKKFLCAALLFSTVFAFAASAVPPRIDLRQASARSKAPGLSVRLYPMAYIDNLFCVLENREQPIVFSFVDCVPGKAKKPLIFKVTVPKGFKINLEYRYMRRISDKKNPDGSVESTYEVKVPHYTDRLTTWGCAFGQISTTVKPDGKRYALKYSVASADGHGGSFSTDLMCIAAEKSPQPQFYKTGAVSCGLLATSLNAEAAKKVASLFKNAGLNMFAADYRIKFPFHNELKKVDVTRCWGWREFLGDGYLIGAAPKPANCRFINAEGKWIARGICPEEAATEGPYYRKHFLAELERMMYKEDFGEHYMVNWEPIPFAKQGCFCPRCKAAFLKFSKISEAELNKVWPKDVLKKYKKLWEKFRAARHAQIVKNIQNAFDRFDRKYNRKERTMFLPEIALANLLKDNEKYLGDFYAEYDARYYEKLIPGLEPWGPYFMHDFFGAYRAIPGRHITMTMIAEETLRQLKERNGGRRPRVYGFPQGIQCGSWITTPEAMAFETIAFFAAGWEGSLLYAFPDGLDGRFWNTVTAGNRLIASHEKFVFKGEKYKDVQTKVISPYPVGIGIDTYTTAGRYFEKDMKNGSMHRAFGFKLGKSYCVALANAWERGKAVIQLRMPKVPAGNYRITLSDMGRVRKFHTNARQLAVGVQIDVPAWSWLFAVIEPDAKGGTMPTVKLSAAEKKELQKHADRDNALLKNASKLVAYRFDDMPFISAGPVTVRPKKNCKPANSILQVTAPGYKGELLMAQGGIFSHVKPAGLSLKNGSFIGGDGVWGAFTGSTNQQPYAFEKWSADGDRVTVVLKSNPAILAGMLVEKTYIFAPQNVSVSVRITNSDDAPFNLNYRLRSYWRMYGKPQVFLGSSALPADKSLFGITARKPVVRPFRNAKAFEAAGAKVVTASVPSRKEKTLAVEFCNDSSGIYFWRSRDDQEFTAEKTFPTVKLMPGKSVTFGAGLSFKGNK